MQSRPSTLFEQFLPTYVRNDGDEGRLFADGLHLAPRDRRVARDCAADFQPSRPLDLAAQQELLKAETTNNVINDGPT